VQNFAGKVGQVVGEERLGLSLTIPIPLTGTIGIEPDNPDPTDRSHGPKRVDGSHTRVTRDPNPSIR
jgi:hypothetical protein